jgi:hypothetical protein
VARRDHQMKSTFENSRGTAEARTTHQSDAVEASKDLELGAKPNNHVLRDESTYLHIDPSIERRVVRKIDIHLIPLLMILCKSISITWTSLADGYP